MTETAQDGKNPLPEDITARLNSELLNLAYSAKDEGVRLRAIAMVLTMAGVSYVWPLP